MAAISQTTISNACSWISFETSLKFVPKRPNNNIPVLVQIMACRRPGDQPLSEPIMVRLPMHICVNSELTISRLHITYFSCPIIHTARQWHCPALCKISEWLGKWNGCYGRLKFREILFKISFVCTLILQRPPGSMSWIGVQLEISKCQYR